MARKTKDYDHRLVIWLPNTEDDHGGTRAENLKRKIIKHLDDADHDGIVVVCDKAPVCEHCGSEWTEDDCSTYNGGCCDEDKKANPELASEEV